MRILVTGADGFVGRHLCRFLKLQGDEVIEAHGPSAGDERKLDITDASDVLERVRQAKPEGVIHLAGFSSVGKSHLEPNLVFQVNAVGTVNLLAAVREAALRARVLLVGSGEMYGSVPGDARATESTPLAPLSPYAASKLAAECAGMQFNRSYGIAVVCARPFNHLGAGQDPGFVVPSFASQVQTIAQGNSEPVLKVGNLEPIRDFSHVLDVVAAYRLLLESGEPGTAYNVCSGEGRSIRSLLDELLSLAGLDASVEVDRSRVRPVEIPRLVGSPERLQQLGWAPSRTVRDALRDVLEEYRRAREL